MKKISYLKSKKAYSLIEMSVVMAIAAILGLLSIGGYTAVRRQLLVDQAAEEVLNNIREVRNNALYVKSTAGKTRAWAIGLSSSNSRVTIYNLVDSNNLCSDTPNPKIVCLDQTVMNPGEPTPEWETHKPLLNGARMTTRVVNSTDSATNRFAFLAYTSPFSKPYLVTNKTISDYQANCVRYYWDLPSNDAGTSKCYWREGNLPTKEFELYRTDTNEVLQHFERPEAYLEITITRSSVSRIIKVDSSGEAKIVQ